MSRYTLFLKTQKSIFMVVKSNVVEGGKVNSGSHDEGDIGQPGESLLEDPFEGERDGNV